MGSKIEDEDINRIYDKLEPEIRRMGEVLKQGYFTEYASINLIDDNNSLGKIKSIISEKKMLNPKVLVVIGIGGSNLGTMAVQEALLGKLYNQYGSETKILYADTVDSDQIFVISKIVEWVLRHGENVLINVVSKSGGTTETIANFQVLIDILKKYKQNYQDYVIVTTDQNSKFFNFALNNKFTVLEIPKKVGGRFSIFSPVGLFPLGILGVNIDELIEGAKIMRDKCLIKNIKINPAALSASIIYNYSKKNKNIHDLFIFSPDLESFGKWYRQLMAESIGKEFNIQQKQIFNGITPTVSIGSTDLHSMAQLYLGGPFDKFTTFISVKNNRFGVEVPNDPEYSQLVEGIQGNRLHTIMDAILRGVQKAFEKGNRPFTEIILPEKSESSIGQLLQLKMMEIMYLGYLMEVNPFDQPNVENYKSETKKILLNNIH